MSAGRNQAGAKTMRALHRNVWLGLALLVVALVAALVLNSDILFDWDHLQIKAERARRHEQATLGVPLSGTPDLAALDRRLAADGLSLGAPVFIRVFKREFELELWMRRDDGFHRFAVYPICRWSGRLGPKLVEGDAQAPEGFYTVDAKALNPTSRWHRSFNLGYPNAYDRSHRRTGSLHHGARRMRLDWLFCHDQPGGGRDLAAGDGGARQRPGTLSGAGLPVPHD